MGQGRQGQGGGQAPRQMQRSQPRVDYEKAAAAVLSGLDTNRPILEPLLPAGTPWARLHATIATLLIQNPGILRCTTASIIRGCMKAVYDGLALDGREAALVPSENTYGKGQNAVTRLEARYNPMVAGLRKQILQGGLVDDVVTTVVFEGEPYKITRGSNPSIEHEEIPAKRGPGKNIVGVYSMAWLKNGRVTFETMNGAQVEAVRAMAATDKVWKANDHEMYRKTVLRRHRKSLPGCNEIRDAEMEILFPHMSTAARPALPAPARPDRRDYQAPALDDQSQSVFHTFDVKADEVFAEGEGGGQEEEGRQAKQADRQPKKGKVETRDDGQGKAEGGEEEAGGGAAAEEKPAYQPQIMVPTAPPSDEAGWRYYADQVKAALPKLLDADAINAERRAHQEMIDQAPGKIGDELADAFADALTDLVAGS